MVDPGLAVQHFEHLSDLVTRTPVVLVRVPWGLPFAADLPERLRDVLLRAAVG